jgi:hypothetical protein
LIDDTSFQLPVYASADSGVHWQRLGGIDSNEGAAGSLKQKGLWEPFLFLLPDGKVSVIYSSETHAGFSQVLSQRTSPDGGQTWGPEQFVASEPGGGKLRPGMGVVARLKNGQYLIVFEIVGIGRGEVHYKISADGISWEPGLGEKIPQQEAAPFVTALPDGRILVTSCSSQLSVSSDLGKTWRTLTETPWEPKFRYDWPALYILDSNHIAAVVSDRFVKLRLGEFSVNP